MAAYLCAALTGDVSSLGDFEQVFQQTQQLVEQEVRCSPGVCMQPARFAWLQSAKGCTDNRMVIAVMSLAACWCSLSPSPFACSMMLGIEDLTDMLCCGCENGRSSSPAALMSPTAMTAAAAASHACWCMS